MGVVDELQKLEALLQSGAINHDEFAAAKAKLLRETPDAASLAEGRYGSSDDASVMREQDVRLWGMLLHLSVLLGYAFPIAGLIAPIAIWQWKKNESPVIDEHGKNAVNWIISELIYGVVGALLCLVLIGIPLLLALLVLGVVFPIIAAIKANNGEVWRYPMSINFVK